MSIKTLFAKKYAPERLEAFIEDWRDWAARADTMVDMGWSKKTADTVVLALDAMQDDLESWLEENSAR